LGPERAGAGSGSRGMRTLLASNTELLGAREDNSESVVISAVDMAAVPFATTHAPSCGQVEQISSNVLADVAVSRSSLIVKRAALADAN